MELMLRDWHLPRIQLISVQAGPGAFLLPIWYENDTGNFFAWDQTTTSWIALAGGGGSGGITLVNWRCTCYGPGSGSQFLVTLKTAAKIRNIGITIGDMELH